MVTKDEEPAIGVAEVEEHAETQPATGAEPAPAAAEPSEVAPAPVRRDVGAPGRPLPRILVGLALVGLVVLGYAYRSAWLAPPAEHATAAPGERKVLYWVDPMHPTYKSDKPGKAPDCGMDLVPVYADGETATAAPSGAFQISSERQQLIGVKYGEVSYQRVGKSLRAVGRVTYDETKIVRVHTKVDGWVEKVYADFTGRLVRKGEPLIDLYSPDLVATQEEYLLAIKNREALAGGTYPELAAGGASLVDAARRRLELWDISDAQIAELERRGAPVKALTLYAPSNGFVLAKNVFAKQRVTADTELYQLADLSTVWVVADVYENEAASVALGQAAAVTLEYAPGKVFRGTVSYVYPQVDDTTRTVRVRVDVPNADFALKPDMYASVELTTDFGRQLVVPEEAVLDSGGTKTVFVALGDGYFEPRAVTLGAKVNGSFVVLAGLAAGERVVTSGNFLIDSESQLKSAAGGMGMPGMDHGSSGAPANEGSGAEVAPHAAPAAGGRVDHSQMNHSGKDAPQPDHSTMDHSTMDHSKMDHSQMDHSNMNHSGTGAAPPPHDRR